MQRILYYIFIYNILFEGVWGMRKAPEVTKKTPAEVAHTGQGGAKAIATRSRNSRAQDNVEREQIKAG